MNVGVYRSVAATDTLIDAAEMQTVLSLCNGAASILAMLFEPSGHDI